MKTSDPVSAFEQRALAGVGVAHQRNRHLRPPCGDLALAAMFDGAKLLPQVADPLFGQPAVDFQLLFAGAAQPDAALRLPREVRPHPLQARHLVFQLGQLDRQAGLVRLGPAGEDVENQLRAVEDLQPGGFLKVPRLAGAEIVVEDDHVGHFGVSQGGQLLHLSLAQIGCRVRGFAALGQLAYDVRAGGLGKTFQFLQRDQLMVLVRGTVLTLREKDAHEDGRLAYHALGATDLLHSSFFPQPVRCTGRVLSCGRPCRTATIIAQPRSRCHAVILLSVLVTLRRDVQTLTAEREEYTAPPPARCACCNSSRNGVRPGGRRSRHL